ncbi:hypothetical protein RB653_000607 [Dictyostelium firmibasis]|uniref:Uncharacterized protein n=1 Tax=Dictyostelium firmibasis TaxID=79012 RepID=A0AAN7U2K7_9MYCE
MKPFTNSECGGESEGIGYIFNQNQDSCIILSNSTNSINSGMEINVFGEIASFQIFNTLDCKTNSNDPKPIAFAFKHNQCVNLPTMFNYNFNETDNINSFNTDNVNQYFQMNIISSQIEINQIIDQVYGVKKFQYQTSNQCSDSNFQLIQFFTNNFNITSSSSAITTILCNSQKEPTIQQCSNGGQCVFESLYLPCSEIIFENDYNLVQTC